MYTHHLITATLALGLAPRSQIFRQLRIKTSLSKEINCWSFRRITKTVDNLPKTAPPHQRISQHHTTACLLRSPAHPLSNTHIEKIVVHTSTLTSHLPTK